MNTQKRFLIGAASAVVISLTAAAASADAGPAWAKACPNAVEFGDGEPVILPPVKGSDIVRVRVIIGLEGKVVAARVLTTTNPKMNDTALNGVRNWKYPPRSDCAAAEAEIEFKH
jgi:hypothetical protein